MIFGLFKEDNVKFVIDYINSITEYTKNGKLKDFLIKSNFIDRDGNTYRNIFILYEYIFNKKILPFGIKSDIDYDRLGCKDKSYYNSIVKIKDKFDYYFKICIKEEDEFYKKAYENNFIDYPYNLIKNEYRKGIIMKFCNDITPYLFD